MTMSTMPNQPKPAAAQPSNGNSSTQPEKLIWSGTPSQWTNILWFVSCILILPIPFAIYHWLRVKCTKFALSSQRLRVQTGILTRHFDDLELYRVKDSAISQPFIQRLVGLGNIDLVTSDASTPKLRLAAIPNALEVHDILRSQVERVRRERGVRELDVSDSDVLAG